MQYLSCFTVFMLTLNIQPISQKGYRVKDTLLLPLTCGERVNHRVSVVNGTTIRPSFKKLMILSKQFRNYIPTFRCFYWVGEFQRWMSCTSVSTTTRISISPELLWHAHYFDLLRLVRVSKSLEALLKGLLI